jgi:ribosomal protein L11 methylase PrmA
MKDMLYPDSASFRDPSGRVFWEGEKVYREVYPPYLPTYRKLMGNGLYDTLSSQGMLIPHTEIEGFAKGAAITIRPELIPFISYPYEWSFGQLKDAALLTLAINRIALDHHMSLKDASAYNIQFLNGKPTLIDTLSFEEYQPNAPWVAYRQFCQHFLAPLALASYTDRRLSQLLSIHLDGIPLDLASTLLPAKTRANLGLLTHLHAHSASQKKYQEPSLTPQASFKVAKNSLLGMLDHLQSTITRLSPKKNHSEWGTYYQNTNYSPESFEYKKATVKDFLHHSSPRIVWDVGANTGEFSALAAEAGAFVLATDMDTNAVETLYRQHRAHSILPLVVDIVNPSPAIGWANVERRSFLERIRPDLIMALALVHHLAISNNLPLRHIASFFAGTAPWLIVEFVPKEDSQVRRLLSSREDIFPNYNEKDFEECFGDYYSIEKKKAVPGTLRSIYLMRRRTA